LANAQWADVSDTGVIAWNTPPSDSSGACGAESWNVNAFLNGIQLTHDTNIENWNVVTDGRLAVYYKAKNVAVDNQCQSLEAIAVHDGVTETILADYAPESIYVQNADFHPAADVNEPVPVANKDAVEKPELSGEQVFRDPDASLSRDRPAVDRRGRARPADCADSDAPLSAAMRGAPQTRLRARSATFGLSPLGLSEPVLVSRRAPPSYFSDRGRTFK
jgi:hypothetical protein